MATSDKVKESFHRMLEGRGALFAVCTTVAILIGGLVEIVPMFTATLGPEPLPGVTPYTPLEVAGRDRIALTPSHEQQISGKRLGFVMRFIGDNFHAVRRSVRSLECSRPGVHRHVSANGVGVAT